MKTIKKIFLICSFFYFLTGNAQAPEKMSFQAVIRNASNVLVSNHAIGMKISILQSSTTGTPVYVETQTPTSNSNGLVTIQIGAGTAVSGSIIQINWSAASYFIKTEVDPTGGTNYTISTVSQLLSVPYALFAKTAASATDNNAWKKTGNSNIDPTTQFIGTTDDNALQFKVNNEKSGIIETNDNTNNTIKNANTAFGYQSLNSNQLGSYNVATGYQSLFSNTIGGFNVANGVQSLYANTTGNYNVANGTFSLSSNTIGDYNVATGYQSLISNTTGSFNVANGSNSLRFNTTGSYNVANGNMSLYENTTGSFNVANGDQSLYANTTGHDNVANGSQSLYLNTVGNYNVAVGNGSLYSNTSSYNVATGFGSLYSNTDGFFNVANGYHSLGHNTTGNSNTAIGYGSGFDIPNNVNNVTCVGSVTGWNTTSSNQVNIGDFSVTSIGGQVNWGTYSDKRIKTDVKENVPGLAFIKQLTPVTYHLDIKKQYELAMNGKKDESADYPEKYDIEKITQTGFLAQDVETASKNVGYNFSGVEVPKNGQGLYKLRYAEFVVPLVQAVKEQQTQIEELKKENAEIKKLLQQLLDKK